MTFLYVILGIIGFCVLVWVLYVCVCSEVAEYDDHQENGVKQDNNMAPSRYSIGEPSENQNERQENNLNPAFNPKFNPTAIEMPPNPEYEARNNFPSSFQTNTYEANNPMTPSSNLPYSLTPGEANGNQNGSEPAYAGGWVNQS